MVLRNLLRDESGAAAEFALVLPLMVVLFFGIIDGGRYMWEVNRAEKATQAGARAAAVTRMIPAGLIGYSFSVSSGVPQGTAVPLADFPGVRCTSNGTTAACTWLTDPRIAIALAPEQAPFDVVLERMQDFMPDLEAGDVIITYSNSGLGFAGDPGGPDIAPIVTVSLDDDVRFEPILTAVFGLTWGLPAAPYSVSQEDGVGTCFEEVC